MITRNNKINRSTFVLLMAFLFVSTNFLGYKYWGSIMYVLYLPFYAYFIYVCLRYHGRIKSQKANMSFSKLTKWLIIIPFLYLISHFVNGYTVWMSHPSAVIQMLGSLTFLTYFVLYVFHVNEKTIITLLTTMALMIFIVQVVQQLNPEGAIFGVASNPDDVQYINSENEIEVRNGLYRFRISGTLTTIVAMCYYWQSLLKKKDFKSLLFFLIFSASLYLTLTRQYIFAGLGMCVCSFFLMGNRKMSTKFTYIIPILLFLFLIYQFRDALFGSLLEQTQDQAADAESNVRVLGMAYYWNEIVSHPLTFLFGAGPTNSATDFSFNLHLFWDDIGFIGQWFVWGIGIILSYLYILIQVFFKRSRQIPPYIKFFVFLTLITSIFIFPYRFPSEFFVWSCLLYISDLHISNSPLALNN